MVKTAVLEQLQPPLYLGRTEDLNDLLVLQIPTDILILFFSPILKFQFLTEMLNWSKFGGLLKKLQTWVQVFSNAGQTDQSLPASQPEALGGHGGRKAGLGMGTWFPSSIQKSL